MADRSFSRRWIWAIVGLLLWPSLAFAEPDLDIFFVPEAYLDPLDRQLAARGVGTPERPMPCVRRIGPASRQNFIVLPTDKCVVMQPRRIHSGLWRNEFEISRFCPEPATRCSYETPGANIWLTWNSDKRYPDGLYRVIFSGHQTRYRGAFGHMEYSEHETLVDRMIWIERVRR